MEVENFSKLLNEVVSNGKINFYYYSDPTSSNIELHHLAIPFPGELSPVDLPFRWHAEKPSEDLADAIWDDETHSWVENSDKSQPALIAKLQANNEAIQKKMEIYEQDKIADAEKNDKLVQALTGVQKGQAQTTEVLARLVPMVQQLSKLVTSSDEAEKAKKEEGAE